MTTRKTKTIRTLPDLQQALCTLWPGADCKAEKIMVQRHDRQGKSVHEFYQGEIFVMKPSDGGEVILITRRGPTPLDAFLACRDKLIETIEERARKRQLPAATTVIEVPRRLTHS